MTFTIKITGSIEKSYKFEAFPTKESLKSIGFYREYSVGAFEEKLERMQQMQNGLRYNGEIRLMAVLRRGVPTIRVTEDQT